MASAVDLHVWRREAAPAAIEQELAALWADLGRERPVARAMMSNLVVLKECPAMGALDLTAAPAGLPLDEVAQRHPARIVLVYHVRSAPANCPPIAAAVSVTTFGAPAARYGIETIAVESRCAPSSLPSIVRRLTMGDLPTTLWWTDDLSDGGPEAPLASMARQLLYDSSRWRDPAAGFAAAARVLSADAAPDLADLNWRRLAPLRSALTSIVRRRNDVLAGGLGIHIAHRPGERALADLLGGWIGARLRWQPGERAEIVETAGAEVLRLTMRDESGHAVEATQADERVVVHDWRVASPIVLPVPRESAAEAVAMELATLSQDVCLRDALLAIAARR